MNIATALERSARLFPNRTAVIYKGQAISYGELNARVNRLGNSLQGLGIGKGDHACLMLPNSPEFIISYFALQKIGAVPVSLNVMFKRDESRYIASDSSARLFIIHEALTENLPERGDLPHLRHIIVVGEGGRDAIPFQELINKGGEGLRALDLNRDDTAAILYTSATTGLPKGVMLTHANLTCNSYAACHHLKMTPEDIHFLALPLFHVFGQNFIMLSAVNSASTILLHERFIIEEALESIRRHRATILYGVPTIYLYILNAEEALVDMTSVRLFFSAAATMPRSVAEGWRERFKREVNEGYGLTESSPFASWNHDYEYRFGSIGSPIENVEMKVFDENDNELPPGELGEIVIRGPNVMKGYLGREEDTKEALRSGWLHSGDIGYYDEEGYFYIVDRVKDMINVAGFKVYPREVEEVLFKHPAVKEAAVIGVPDPVKGEGVKAYIVLKEGMEMSEEDIIDYCKARIASFKAPRCVEFIDSLPKSPSGKILKKELRARESGRAGHQVAQRS